MATDRLNKFPTRFALIAIANVPVSEYTFISNHFPAVADWAARAR